MTKKTFFTKSLIAIALALILVLGAGFDMTRGIVDAIEGRETPIANIQDDNHEVVSIQNLSTDFVTVRQTITVMTTATGHVDRLNYVPSVPIRNALVRLDGVPRWTNSQGQITANISREWVELHVQVQGFNPHIEVIQAFEGNRTIRLKKPSDDIEIYAALLTHNGDTSNLLLQQYSILEHEAWLAISNLEIRANIQACTYYLFANDEIVALSFDGTFRRVDWSRFTNELSVDENDNVKIDFSIMVEFQGVRSIAVPLIMHIHRLDPDNLEDLIREGFEDDLELNPEFGDEDDPMGSGGEVNFSMQAVRDAILAFIIPAATGNDASVQLGQGPVRLTITFNARKMQLGIIIGFQHTFERTLYDSAYSVRHNQRNEHLLENERLGELAMAAEQERLDAIAEGARLERDFNNATSSEVEDRILREIEMNELRQDIASRNAEQRRHDFIADTEYNPNFIYATNYVNNLMREHEQRESERRTRRNHVSRQIEREVQQASQARNVNMNDIVNRLSGLDQQLKKLDSTLKELMRPGNSSQHKVGLSLDIKLIGKMTLCLRNFEVVKASVYGEAMVKVSYTFQKVIMAGPVPIPFFVKLTVGVGLRVVVFDYDAKEGMPQIHSFSDWFDKMFHFAILLHVRIDAGVGIAGVISLGGFGTGDFEFWFLHPGRYVDCMINGKVFVDGNFGIFSWGFGFKAQFLIWSFERVLLGGDILMYGSSMREQAVAEQFSTQLLSRSLTSNAISNNQMGGVFQSSTSQITPIGNGDYLLTWTADVPSRDDYNRTALMYAVYSNGVISEPKILMDDGYADFAHTIHIQDGRTFIAWQRTMDTIKSTMGPEDISNALDIFVAEFDKNTGEFVNAQRITDDNATNSDPQFVMNAGVPTLTWKSSVGGDFLGFGGTTQISSTRLTGGTWGDNQVLHSSINPIFNHTASIINGQMVLAVEEVIGDDIFNFETEINIIRGSSITQLTISEAHNPNFILMDGLPALLFSQENNLMSTTNFVDVRLEIEQFATDFRVNNFGEFPTLIYEQLDSDNLRQGHIAVYRDGRWTRDIVLTDEQNPQERIFGTFVHNNGDTVTFVYNVEDEFGNVSLTVGSREIFASVNVEAFAPNGITSNSYNLVRLVVENTGATLVDALRISVLGQEIYINNFEPMSIGQVRELDFELFMNGVNGQNIQMHVDILGSSGQTLDTQIVELTTKLSNIATEFSMQIVNGKQVFTVNLVNNGEFTTATRLHIWLNEEIYKTIDVVLAIGEEWSFSVSFDEISISDSVIFLIVTEFEDINPTDKLGVFFSIQDEAIARPPSNNPFGDLLNDAKGVAF